MMDMLQFDEEGARRVEEVYRTPDVIEQRLGVLRALALAPGERALDIGAGPGFLACEMAETIGPQGAVHGIDPSESMLAIARRQEPAPGSAPVRFAVGDACAIPSGDATFDAAVSTQVYEYVPDMPTALAEAHRVLRPGGRLLVLDTDWDSVVWHSSDRARMERVLAAWEEHLADPRLPRRLGGLLEDAGFEVRSRSVMTLLNAGYDPATFSAGLIDVIASYVPGHRSVTEEEAAAWADDLRGLGRAYFFSLNRYLFLATR